MLTQERLKQLLKYNPDTGEFTNISCRGGAARVGSLAGHYGIYGGKLQVKLHIDRKSYKGSRVAWSEISCHASAAWMVAISSSADFVGQNLAIAFQDTSSLCLACVPCILLCLYAKAARRKDSTSSASKCGQNSMHSAKRAFPSSKFSVTALYDKDV